MMNAGNNLANNMSESPTRAGRGSPPTSSLLPNETSVADMTPTKKSCPLPMKKRKRVSQQESDHVKASPSYETTPPSSPSSPSKQRSIQPAGHGINVNTAAASVSVASSSSVRSGSSNTTQRKRLREQNRRAAVAKGLEALAKMVCRIDPCLKDSASTPGGVLTNRVTLVNHATVMLERIHAENQRRLERMKELSDPKAATATQAAPLKQSDVTTRTADASNTASSIGVAVAKGEDRKLPSSEAPPTPAAATFQSELNSGARILQSYGLSTGQLPSQQQSNLLMNYQQQHPPAAMTTTTTTSPYLAQPPPFLPIQIPQQTGAVIATTATAATTAPIPTLTVQQQQQQQQQHLFASSLMAAGVPGPAPAPVPSATIPTSALTSSLLPRRTPQLLLATAAPPTVATPAPPPIQVQIPNILLPLVLPQVIGSSGTTSGLVLTTAPAPTPAAGIALLGQQQRQLQPQQQQSVRAPGAELLLSSSPLGGYPIYSQQQHHHHHQQQQQQQ